MTIFNISLANIKKNFRNYFSYFLASTFSVFVVYLFSSIINNSAIQDQLGGSKKFLMSFNAALDIIIIFSAFFIWYSNSFFIKARKKEFATYMLLGMSKKQVSRLNFFENIIIALMSLLTGIVLGIIFTKFFIMLLFFIMKTPGTVNFQFSFKALETTLIVFFIIFGIISIYGAILIRKSKLIDLFNAARKKQKMIKASLLTGILGIISLICMFYGYYIAIKELTYDFFKLPVAMVLIIIGTILFFTSTVSVIIFIGKKNEKSLYKGTKLISSSQLSYRYSSNVGALSIIAITTTVALSALILCVGTYIKAEDNSRYMRPNSVEYYNVNSADSKFESILKKHSEVSVKYENNICLLDVNGKNPNSKLAEDFYIIGESKFNKIRNDEKNGALAKLKNSNECYFVQIQTLMAGSSPVGKSAELNASSGNYKLKVVASDDKIFLALDHAKDALVVKDSVFNKLKASTEDKNIINLKGYGLKDDFKASKLAYDLQNNMPKESNVLTFYEHYRESMKLLGIMAFIGLFLGIIFITATGSIMHFKVAVEAREDKSKFETLRKIGVSKKEIKSAVSKELRLLFGMPMVVAAINGYPATVGLGNMTDIKLVNVYFAILIVYILVYFVYYLVTLNSYMKIIAE